MKKWMSKLLVAAIALALFTGAASYVSARAIGEYEMNLPRFGFNAYTNSLTKENQSRAVNHNTSIGGGYSMTTAVYWNGERISKKVDMNSGSRVLIPYHEPYNFVGSNVRLGMWSGFTTHVKVSVSGSWSPDEN